MQGSSQAPAQRDPLRDVVGAAKSRFMQFGQPQGWGEIQFAREAEFAVQALRTNDFTMKVAMQSEAGRMSLRDAIVQSAVLGISLNPALGHAYLVPYGDRIVFQPSYRGLRDLAIEDKLIRWARSEVVHKNDVVRLRNAEDGQRFIEHEFDPFGDRGEVVGAYCAWEDGDERRDLVFETEAEIISSHRSRSIAFTKGNGGIWKTDPNEARRKALMKRAQKSWPRRTDRRASRFDDALAAEYRADDSIETTASEVRRTPESARIAKPSETPHQGKASTLVPIAKSFDRVENAMQEREDREPLNLTGEPSDQEAESALGMEVDDLLDNLAGDDGGVRVQYETAARKSAGLAEGKLDLIGLTALRDELARAIAERAE